MNIVKNIMSVTVYFALIGTAKPKYTFVGHGCSNWEKNMVADHMGYPTVEDCWKYCDDT